MSTTLTADAGSGFALPAELCREAGFEPGKPVTVVGEGQLCVQTPGLALAELIVALARLLPPEVLDRLPADGASQNDHYFHGTPKRPE
jgi:hypothetical protein